MEGISAAGSLSLRHKGRYSMEYSGTSFLQNNGFVLEEFLESYGKVKVRGKSKKIKRNVCKICPVSCEIWASKFADEGNEKRICAN